jgi:hypothetical protein
MRIICYLLFLFLVIEGKLASSQPVAAFTPSRFKICSGTTFNLINSSTGANSFQWFVDGQFYSAAIDTSISLTENCYDMKAIKLIGCDTLMGTCDSATQLVEVFDSCFFHWTGDILRCPGDTVSLTTHPEAINTFWNINPPHAFLTGCDTCSAISIIIQQNGTLIDKMLTYLGNCNETVSYHYLCMTAGIEKLNSELEIFPNPFTNFISIKNLSLNIIEQILMYDNIGKELKKLKPASSVVDFSDLPSGLYYLKVQFEKGYMNEKVYKLIKL